MPSIDMSVDIEDLFISFVAIWTTKSWRTTAKMPIMRHHIRLHRESGVAKWTKILFPLVASWRFWKKNRSARYSLLPDTNYKMSSLKDVWTYKNDRFNETTPNENTSNNRFLKHWTICEPVKSIDKKVKFTLLLLQKVSKVVQPSPKKGIGNHKTLKDCFSQEL